jgi:hypothetical protein
MTYSFSAGEEWGRKIQRIGMIAIAKLRFAKHCCIQPALLKLKNNNSNAQSIDHSGYVVKTNLSQLAVKVAWLTAIVG